jgi:hypothetical protein
LEIFSGRVGNPGLISVQFLFVKVSEDLARVSSFREEGEAVLLAVALPNELRLEVRRHFGPDLLVQVLVELGHGRPWCAICESLQKDRGSLI